MPLHDRRLRRSAYAVDAASLARSLLGCFLVRVLDDGSRLAGRIVETEAYTGVEDRASHAFGGRRTARNESMYGAPGTAYVYFTYGMHHCVNVACAAEGDPQAVLVRALEPMEGLERMAALRGPRRGGAPREIVELCSGPGKLCQALAIDRSLDGLDLTRDHRLFVTAGGRSRAAQGAAGLEHPGGTADKDVVRTARIGVEYAEDWAAAPLRWFVRSSPHVSGRRGGGRG